MSAPPQRMDDLQPNADAPAAVDPVGIKQFIADRESSIDRISIELLREEERVSNCADAIKDLELAISQRTAAIEAHEKYIAALDLIQSRTKGQGAVRPARSGALHQARVRSSSRVPFDSGTVDNEIEVARRGLEEMRCSLVELGLELDTWRGLHELSTATVESLASLKDKQEEIMEKGRMRDKQTLMWRFPVEVWYKIFKLAMEDELKDLPDSQYWNPFYTIIPRLSQVCRAWRSMVAIMPEVRSYISVPHRRVQNPNYDGFYHFVSRAQAPITFLCCLPPNSGTRIWPPNVNNGLHSILEEKPYALRLYVYDQRSYYAQRMASTPFKQPASIVIIPKYPTKIFDLSTRFETTTSLAFINSFPQDCISGPLHSVFPALTTLNLALQDISDRWVRLDENFLASLKELHICVKSGVERISLGCRVNMPNLQVFGITDYGGSIIQMVEATALRTLMFYSQTDQTLQQIVNPLNPVHNRSWLPLSCLELHDWNDKMRGPFNTGTAAVLTKLVPSMPALKSVRLVGGSINGEELVEVMTDLAPRNLELTLAYASGITRDHCDQLKPLTSQLRIYV